MFPTYRYQRNDNDNDNTRGRHLVAARCIDKNELILIERPLVSLQSLENLHSSTLVCRYCRAHCGQPTDSLQLVSQCQTRCQIVMKNHNRNNNKNEQPHDSDNNNNNNNNDTLVSCPQNCGEIYCSRACQQDHWPVHRLLCTGTIPQKQEEEEEDDDNHHYDPPPHPLIEFKSHAIQTNEIFLLVADVVCGLLAFSHEKDHAQQVLDFTQTPWWDIVAQAQPQQLQSLSSKDDEEEDEATTLQDTLRTMCTDAAELLRQHVTNLGIIDDDDNNNNNACNSYLTAQFFGQYIGALEQNAIGIRKRSPLCRQIIMDGQFRTQNHAVLLHCLEHAGMIGSGGECDDDEEECIDEEEEDPQAEQQQQQQEEHVDNTNQQETTEWDYSVPEIASFLAGLDMDELDNGGGGGGDDWDTIFPPLDGTAMYSMTCKMNHSCDPNVVVLYRSHHHHQDWSSSSREPLVLHSVAIRDIAVGEELCISYIDTSRSVEERQQELRDNYGFHCRCRKCVAEEDSNNSNNNTDNLTTNQDKQEKGEANAMDDLFGEDDDDDSNGDEKAEEEEDGETLLARRLTELNTAANQSTVGAVPIKILGGVFGLVVQKGTAVQSQAQQVYPQHVLDCLQAVRERDFCLCQSAGMALEAALYQDLVREGGFPTSAHREAYICGAVVAAVGHAHLGSFLSALVMLDKAMILGLPRRATAVPEFVDYVEHFANATAKTPLPPSVSAIIGCYDKTTRLSERGLSKPIEFPVDEKHMDAMLPDSFAPEFVAKERCVVLRGFAKSWPAIDKWRNLKQLVWDHGHRTVPIEVGTMMRAGGMGEKLMTIRQFVDSFLAPSCDKEIWSLKDAVDGSANVAYLAQHVLLNQIPALLNDVPSSPPLIHGNVAQINAWIGTGGTRTPLHFDSYDNLLVQIAGAKYVRLYARSETPKLYVSKQQQYARQGNMSQVDCEREDADQHPLAMNAEYQETLLLPGDCLFIPAGKWHYVRSLSTSISVNYWW